MIPVIDAARCTGCRKCVEVCPPQAIVLEEKKVQVEEEFCEECGFCAAACPSHAIDIPFPKACS